MSIAKARLSHHGAGAVDRGHRPPLRPGLPDGSPASQRASSRLRHRDGPLRPVGPRAYGLCRHPLARRTAPGLVAGGTRTAPGRTGLGRLDRTVSVAALQRGYLGGGWYHFYDLATDVAMWGAHTVAQALAGLDMDPVTSIKFEYAGPRCDDGDPALQRGEAGAVPGQRLGVGTVPVLAWSLWGALRRSRRLGLRRRRLCPPRRLLARAVARVQEDCISRKYTTRTQRP